MGIYRQLHFSRIGKSPAFIHSPVFSASRRAIRDVGRPSTNVSSRSGNSKVRVAATINKMVSAFGRMSGPAPEVALLAFQCIAVSHRFEFHADGVGDGDDGATFEGEGRQHRT